MTINFGSVISSMMAIAQAFATQAGVFDSSIGHLVDAERGNVTGDQSADFKFVIGLEEQLHIAGKYPCLQAIVGVVDAAKRFVEVVVGLDSNDGAEDFLAIHFHVRLGAGENGGIDDGTGAAAAAQQARAGAYGLFDSSW